MRGRPSVHLRIVRTPFTASRNLAVATTTAAAKAPSPREFFFLAQLELFLFTIVRTIPKCR